MTLWIGIVILLACQGDADDGNRQLLFWRKKKSKPSAPSVESGSQRANPFNSLGNVGNQQKKSYPQHLMQPSSQSEALKDASFVLSEESGGEHNGKVKSSSTATALPLSPSAHSHIPSGDSIMGMFKDALVADGAASTPSLWRRFDDAQKDAASGNFRDQGQVNVFAVDLVSAWRTLKDQGRNFPENKHPIDASPVKVGPAIRTRSGTKRKPDRNALTSRPSPFEELVQRIPPVLLAPSLVLVWAASESLLHAEPWRFGHSLGMTGGRRACTRWHREKSSLSWIGGGSGVCSVGKECFWADLIHPNLARRSLLTVEPTWERGRCGDREREALCFLRPKAAAWHAVTVPFPSPFSASSQGELEDHVAMVLWEGRRTLLAAHVFPFNRDVPTATERRQVRARAARHAREAALQFHFGHNNNSEIAAERGRGGKGKSAMEIAQDKASSSFGFGAVEVQATRLRRALRTACQENSHCASLDSDFETEGEEEEANGNPHTTTEESLQSPLEESVRPVGRRAVAASFLSSDFCLMPPLSSSFAGGTSVTRPALIDALLAGCIPVFFSTCLHERLAFETIYAPYFLPAHRRGNVTEPPLGGGAESFRELGGDWVSGENNGGFGVGMWAVLIDARLLRLSEDGEAPKQAWGGLDAHSVRASKLHDVAKFGGGVSGEKAAEKEFRAAYFNARHRNEPAPRNGGPKKKQRTASGVPSHGRAERRGLLASEGGASSFSVEYDIGLDEVGDGSMDDPIENERRATAAAKVFDYLARIPPQEKRRMRRVIASAIPKLQYAYSDSDPAPYQKASGDDHETTRRGWSVRKNQHRDAQVGGAGVQSSDGRPRHQWNHHLEDGKDDLATSAGEVVRDLLAHRFDAKTCSDVPCSQTAFSLADDVAGGSSAGVSGAARFDTDDQAGAAPEFKRNAHHSLDDDTDGRREEATALLSLSPRVKQRSPHLHSSGEDGKRRSNNPIRSRSGVVVFTTDSEAGDDDTSDEGGGSSSGSVDGDPEANAWGVSDTALASSNNRESYTGVTFTPHQTAHSGSGRKIFAFDGHRNIRTREGEEPGRGLRGISLRHQMTLGSHAGNNTTHFESGEAHMSTRGTGNISERQQARRRLKQQSGEEDQPAVCGSKTAWPLPQHHQCWVSDGSWFAARAHCESAGARLCTEAELRLGLGWSTGCPSSDTQPIWTQTPCGGGSGSMGGGVNAGGVGAFVLVNQARTHEHDRDSARDFFHFSQGQGADHSGWGNSAAQEQQQKLFFGSSEDFRSGFGIQQDGTQWDVWPDEGRNGWAQRSRRRQLSSARNVMDAEAFGSLLEEEKEEEEETVPALPSIRRESTQFLLGRHLTAAPANHTGASLLGGPSSEDGNGVWTRRLREAPLVSSPWSTSSTWDSSPQEESGHFTPSELSPDESSSPHSTSTDSANENDFEVVSSRNERHNGGGGGGGWRVGGIAKGLATSTAVKGWKEGVGDSFNSFSKSEFLGGGDRSVGAWWSTSSSQEVGVPSSQKRRHRTSKSDYAANPLPLIRPYSKSAPPSAQSSSPLDTSLATPQMPLPMTGRERMKQRATNQKRSREGEGGSAPVSSDDETEGASVEEVAAQLLQQQQQLRQQQLRHQQQGSAQRAQAVAFQASSLSRRADQSILRASTLCLPAVDLGYFEHRPPSPVCCADFFTPSNDGGSSDGRGHCDNKGSTSAERERAKQDGGGEGEDVDDKRGGGSASGETPGSSSGSLTPDSRSSITEKKTAAEFKMSKKVARSIGGASHAVKSSRQPPASPSSLSSSSAGSSPPSRTAVRRQIAVILYGSLASFEEGLNSKHHRHHQLNSSSAHQDFTSDECSEVNERRAHAQQLFKKVAATQRTVLLSTLTKGPKRSSSSASSSSSPTGADVHIYVVVMSSPRHVSTMCSEETTDVPEWNTFLRAAYSPFLTRVVVAESCTSLLQRFSPSAPGATRSPTARRCLVDHALDLVQTSFVPYEFVLLGRADLTFPSTGRASTSSASLVADMVSVPDRLTFPFKCDASSWSSWQCAADMLISIPGQRLHSFRRSCVGYRADVAQCFSSPGSEQLSLTTTAAPLEQLKQQQLKQQRRARPTRPSPSAHRKSKRRRRERRGRRKLLGWQSQGPYSKQSWGAGREQGEKFEQDGRGWGKEDEEGRDGREGLTEWESEQSGGGWASGHGSEDGQGSAQQPMSPTSLSTPLFSPSQPETPQPQAHPHRGRGAHGGLKMMVAAHSRDNALEEKRFARNYTETQGGRPGAPIAAASSASTAARFKSSKAMSAAQAKAKDLLEAGDDSKVPHDGSGCYQCAVRTAARHVTVDTTFTNTDYPGNDYRCFDLITPSLASSDHEHSTLQCESSCAAERFPRQGRCQAWSLRFRSRPPHTCCLKGRVSDQTPTSRMVSGILASEDSGVFGDLAERSGHGGLAGISIGFARDEMRHASQWRTTGNQNTQGRDSTEKNPYFWSSAAP